MDVSVGWPASTQQNAQLTHIQSTNQINENALHSKCKIFALFTFIMGKIHTLVFLMCCMITDRLTCFYWIEKFSMLQKYVNRSVYIEHMKNAYMKFQESIK